jgi:hypothetical protein
LKATSVTFGTGSLTAITGYSRIGSAPNWGISGNPQLYFEYLTSTEKEQLTALPLLHLKSIALPYPMVVLLTVRGDGNASVPLGITAFHRFDRLNER